MACPDCFIHYTIAKIICGIPFPCMVTKSRNISIVLDRIQSYKTLTDGVDHMKSSLICPWFIAYEYHVKIDL